jgi:hypothetical protein
MTTELEEGEGQPHAPTAFYPGKDPVPIVQEAGWAPGTVWTGAENLAPTGIRSPNRPARSQSLYRLSYPAHGGNIPPSKKNLASINLHALMYRKTGSSALEYTTGVRHTSSDDKTQTDGVH